MEFARAVLAAQAERVCAYTVFSEALETLLGVVAEHGPAADATQDAVGAYQETCQQVTAAFAEQSKRIRESLASLEKDEEMKGVAKAVRDLQALEREKLGVETRRHAAIVAEVLGEQGNVENAKRRAAKEVGAELERLRCEINNVCDDIRAELY